MKNQRVVYRTVSDVFIATVFRSPASVGTVFMEMLENIDIKDNCVQCKWSEIVAKTGMDKGNASRALARLKEDDLVKEVVDIRGDKRLMINPKHLWSTSRDLLRFSIVMYDLGSHEESAKHRAAEKDTRSTIDHTTGLMSSSYQVGVDRLIELEEAYERLLGSE